MEGAAQMQRSSHDQNESPGPDALGGTLRRNILALERRRAMEESKRALQERAAKMFTNFAGSMPFVYLHLAIVGLWIAVNLGWIPALPRFDPSFVVLATAASVEAIFLSTFVLISQNRDAEIAERRAQLDLHINLLAEREISALAVTIRAIAEHLDVDDADATGLEEAQRAVAPEEVLDRLDPPG